MANYDFDEIVRRVRLDPEDFIGECDRQFENQVRHAAAHISNDIAHRHIALLSGPSGSGKTTTAKLLQIRLSELGIQSHVISLDDYYRTVNPDTHPRSSDGGFDFESPDLLDIPLLARHFAELADGQEIRVPKFNFTKQARDEEKARPLCLASNEIAIFEGIHALNPLLSGPIGNRAQKLYVSARSNIVRDGNLYFKGTWTRMIRRLIRDEKFRGTAADYTMTLWANVRQGEKRYISPYKNNTDLKIDSFFPYETCVLRPFALPLLETVPHPCLRREEICEIHPRLESFPTLDQRFVAHDALLREFIGGGSIVY